MIVDVHGHWGPWFFSTSVADAAVNLRVMDECGIDVQLVSAVEAVVYDPLPGNPALVPVLEAAGPRLRGLLVVDPRDLSLAESQLSSLLPTGLFVGAKIHTHYAGSPGGSAAMADALALLASYDLPVLVHTWGEEIVGLADVVAGVPGVRVVAAHFGGPAWPLVPDAAQRTDRLWFEPCWSTPAPGRIRWVLDRVGPERLMFGSDATLIHPAVTLGAIRAAELSAAEEELVMWRNAADVFRLPAPE
ncbi:amidohydrolase family protein [Jiangella rhizosphaerae]|uniref:Metal-dependent hydrolase n=1 Tax=Jiangella rhizosphaerae TaxID=2293569 RepID=A0A418KLF8_9ACTN|nr:amidohydrolase family protein [Jiangella rhizosphaerae]RIQ18374.1 metal-dependent hydrolase [Jiangella rhizosphaerae]